MPGIKQRRPFTGEEKALLQKLKRSQTAESRLVERAKTVLRLLAQHTVEPLPGAISAVPEHG